MATTTMDPYATLGIPAGASQAEAGRAHRRLAKAFHPDVNPGAEAAERMRHINEAWRILSNPARRAQYDAGRASPNAAASWSGQAGAATTYGSRPRSATWTAWPDDRVTSPPRTRRPSRPEPATPSFGDRPGVIFAVWAVLGLLYVIGAWLGSLTP